MTDRRPIICWLVGIAVALLAGVLAWAAMGATTTAQKCVTGEGGSTVTLVVFGALVALAPGSLMVVAWRSKRPLPLVVPAAILATLLAVFAVFMGGQIWWSAHNCMT